MFPRDAPAYDVPAARFASPNGLYFRDAALSADRAVLTKDGETLGFTLPGGEPAFTYPRELRRLAFSPDQALLVAGSKDGVVTFHDPRTGADLLTLNRAEPAEWSAATRISTGAHLGGVSLLRFPRDDEAFLLTGSDSERHPESVAFWSRDGRELARTPPREGGWADAALSPDGRWLVGSQRRRRGSDQVFLVPRPR